LIEEDRKTGRWEVRDAEKDVADNGGDSVHQGEGAVVETSLTLDSGSLPFLRSSPPRLSEKRLSLVRARDGLGGGSSEAKLPSLHDCRSAAFGPTPKDLARRVPFVPSFLHLHPFIHLPGNCIKLQHARCIHICDWRSMSYTPWMAQHDKSMPFIC
jgi:hypothetical protein